MTVLYDLDGTMADLMTPWIKAYNEDFKDNLKTSEIIDWDIKKFIKQEARTKIFKYINEPDFYKKVKPINPIIEQAKSFILKGDLVGVCTSCSNNIEMIKSKLWWLHKYANFIPKANIMFVDNKGLARGDLLIDDRVKNIEDFLLSNPNSRGIIIPQPHNEKEIKRIIRTDLESRIVVMEES